MAEEVGKPVEGVVPEGTPATVAKAPEQFTEIEQKAINQGWRPKEEWDGDPDLWRPAREFVDRGELFKKIDDQSKTIKEFKRTLDELAKHHSRVQKVEYERALADLKAQKKDALNDGDADAVVDIDEKLALVREAQKNAPDIHVPAAPSEPNPLFVSWVERNNWYENQPAMRAYADRLGNELGARGGMSATDVLAHIEREVRKEFAHKFNNPNRDKPGAVEGSTNRGGKGKDTFTLTEDERRAMQRFVKMGAISEEKYIAEIKKTRGVL